MLIAFSRLYATRSPVTHAIRVGILRLESYFLRSAVPSGECRAKCGPPSRRPSPRCQAEGDAMGLTRVAYTAGHTSRAECGHLIVATHLRDHYQRSFGSFVSPGKVKPIDRFALASVLLATSSAASWPSRRTLVRYSVSPTIS